MDFFKINFKHIVLHNWMMWKMFRIYLNLIFTKYECEFFVYTGTIYSLIVHCIWFLNAFNLTFVGALYVLYTLPIEQLTTIHVYV